MRELVVEDVLVEELENTGWLVRKVIYAGRRGSPDRWAVKQGHWLLVETKRQDKGATSQQGREHDRLRGHGQKVYVPDTVAEVRALVARANAFVAQHGPAPAI